MILMVKMLLAGLVLGSLCRQLYCQHVVLTLVRFQAGKVVGSLAPAADCPTDSMVLV